MTMPYFVGVGYGMMDTSYFLLSSVGVVTSTKIFIEGFGNIAFGKYAIFCMWRIING